MQVSVAHAAPLQRLEAEVPESLKDAILSIKPAIWLRKVAAKRYRKCSSLHFGLGIPRNISRKKRFMFGQYSRSLPELQEQLIRFVRGVAPHLDFASIILNMYLPGDYMGVHSDGNLLPLQLSARFGVDAVGGELHCAGQSVHSGVFVMDANEEHWVSPLLSGKLFSIVTYIKKDAFWMADCASLSQLASWGYPLRTVGLFLLYLFCTLVAGPVPVILNMFGNNLTKSKNNMVFLASWNPSS